MLWYILILSIILTIYSKNWIMFWIFLELNTFSFIYILFNNKFNYNSSSSAIIYFIMSFFSTFLILLNFLNYSNIMLMESNFMFNIGLLIKLGVAPFHFWIIQMAKNCSMFQFSILMTIQKIIPISFLMSLLQLKIIFPLTIISLIFLYDLLNSNSIKSIVISSSIVNNNWMIMLCACNYQILLTYFYTYSFIIFQFMYFCMKLNMKNLNNMKKKINLSMLIFSLIGIPPFLGFYIKLISVFHFINLFSTILIMLILIMSIIISYMYLKMIFIPSMMNWNSNFNMNLKILFINLILPMLLFI
uniref:NADH-ubiquinone oxidoreductase chain 2 n=1 Tax=Pyemotes zhonghuajia TaxID=2749944 RepID=A0A8T9JEN1_9ACAR|nr:NADH dehydrogenase subunit 2 [Pyemotes zhonghuajia]UOK09676.1 NADH dehydrogenase subunit 2 [Pyemotes zhonghuajia]